MNKELHEKLLEFVRHTDGDNFDLIKLLRKGYSLWFYNVKGMREPENWRTLEEGCFEEEWRLIAVDSEVIQTVEDMIFYVQQCWETYFRPDGERYYYDLGVKTEDHCYTNHVYDVNQFMKLKERYGD